MKLMMKMNMKMMRMGKAINAINEDFFDDIESKDIINDKIDIVNDEIEQENDTINPEDYTHVLKLSLDIAESISIKDIKEQESAYINDFINTLKIIIKKIEYTLDVSRFVKKHSNIIINQGIHTNYLDDVIDVKGLHIHTTKKQAFENVYDIDLVYYATFNITNPKQAVNFYSQHCERILNRNTIFYVNYLSIERTNKSENRLLLDIDKRFDFSTKVPFFEIQNYIYDLCTLLSDKKDMYSKILKCYSLNNAADSLFENAYNKFSATLRSQNKILNSSPIIKSINMFSVPYFHSEHTMSCKCLDDCPSHYNNLVDWIKKTPFRLYTLVKDDDDEKLEYMVMCVFNGTYNYLDEEYVITISSNCSNMSELNGYGDKRGFYRCLKMIQSLGYSEKDALDMLKSDFERFNDTVYDEFVNNPEFFISAIKD